MKRKGFSSLSDHSLLIDQDGALYAWGDNVHGQLGLGITIDSLRQPQLISGISDKVVSIACGCIHSMVITEGGSLYVWGDNDFGQLGLGHTNSQNYPQEVPGMDSLSAIACGGIHSMALTSSGKIYAWGDNECGQLGLGHRGLNHRSTPQRVNTVDNTVAIACGCDYSMLLTNKGEIYSWGGNDFGQLGLGHTVQQSSPQKVIGVEKGVAIACSFHSMVLTNDGKIFAWGNNDHGQLGLGHMDNQTTPRHVTGIEGVVVAISCGEKHSMALTEDGTLYAWGRNEYGQLGLGHLENQSTPQRVTKIDGIISSIACGDIHSMALTEDGTLYAWGHNVYGQLGLGNTQNQNIPHRIDNLTKGKYRWHRNSQDTEPEFPRDPNEQLQEYLSILLASERYTDFNFLVGGKTFKLHKAILSVRCPRIFQIKDDLQISPAVFQCFIEFVYTNTFHTSPLTLTLPDLLNFLRLSMMLEINELKTYCQQLLICQFSKTNIFELLLSCAEMELKQEVDWIAWYVAKNKIQPPAEAIAKMATRHEILAKLFSQVAHPTLPPPPKFQISIKPLSEAMKELWETKVMSDFQLNVRRSTFSVHKCILGMRWQFFKSILMRAGSVATHQTEMPTSTIEKLMSYFYTRSLDNLTVSDCGWMLSLANFYLLKDDETELLDYCDKIINSQITSSYWFEALQLAVDLGDEELEKKALGVIPSAPNPQHLVSLLLSMMKELHSQKHNHLQIKQQQQATISDLQATIYELQATISELQSTMAKLIPRLDRLEKVSNVF